MILIPDNSTLRSFIPNTFASSVADVPTLYEKLSPFLQSSEEWLFSNLIPREMMERIIDATQSQDEPLYFFPRRVVALRAWAAAVPSLDVVVSHNGIGTVQTQTLAPASKAKIDRLIQSSMNELNTCISGLIGHLHGVQGWHKTSQGAVYRSTLFRSYDSLPLSVWKYDESEDPVTVHDRFRDLVPKIVDIENQIGEFWISMPTLKRLRDLRGEPETCEAYVMSRVRSAVRRILEGDGCCVSVPPMYELEQSVAYILSHPDHFPEFRGTSTERLFKSPAFRNRCGSSGHWL